MQCTKTSSRLSLKRLKVMQMWINEKVGRITVGALFLILGIMLWRIATIGIWFVSGFIYSIPYYVGLVTSAELSVSTDTSTAYMGICMGVIALIICFVLKRFSRFDCSVEMFFLMVFYTLTLYLPYLCLGQAPPHRLPAHCRLC